MEKKSVLFLCTANSARSVMAEAFLRRAVGDRLEVTSAGLEPKPINPLTVRVMREVGIELEGRQPRSVADYLGRKTFQYVVTVCKPAEASCPIVWPFALSQLSWPYADPAAVEGSDDERLAAFRSVRDGIDARVSAWVAELKASGTLS